MKYKSIALFCAFTIAAFAVANIGFAKDASPPGSEFVQPNVNTNAPSIEIALVPIVAPVEYASFAVTQEIAFVAKPVLAVKTRPPNRTQLDGSTYTNMNLFSGARCSLRPDH